jgi:hypothetical protein
MRLTSSLLAAVLCLHACGSISALELTQAAAQRFALQLLFHERSLSTLSTGDCLQVDRGRDRRMAHARCWLGAAIALLYSIPEAAELGVHASAHLGRHVLYLLLLGGDNPVQV